MEQVLDRQPCPRELDLLEGHPLEQLAPLLWVTGTEQGEEGLVEREVELWPERALQPLDLVDQRPRQRVERLRRVLVHAALLLFLLDPRIHRLCNLGLHPMGLDS